MFTFTLPGHDKGYISNVTKDDWVNACEEQIAKFIFSNQRKELVKKVEQ